MKWTQIARKAKKVVDDRGGTEVLKQDFNELKDIARSKGDLKTKSKAAAAALKQKGAPPAESGEPGDVPPAPS
jgi:hypothetical protein